MTENKTPIYLSDEEMEVFKWCWKSYKIIRKTLTIKSPKQLVFNINAKNDVKPELHLFGNASVENL